MSRKDYVAIAKAIDETLFTCEQDSAEAMAVTLLATKLADIMSADNARFDREKFLTAAGVK